MKPLLSEEEIRGGVRRLAGEIEAFYAGRSLTIVCVLTGSLVFVADLIRRLDLPLRLALVQARSYRGTATAPEQLTMNMAMVPDIADRHVLLVDDIFDTGHTLCELMGQLGRMAPLSLRSAVLLRKLGRQQVAIRPDHVAFDIPDRFVVGYGLDFNDLYRNLPYVAVLDDAELGKDSA